MTEPFPARLRRWRRLACRLGLHLLDWDDRVDGWRCACRRQFLWGEQLSNRDDWRRWWTR